MSKLSKMSKLLKNILIINKVKIVKNVKFVKIIINVQIIKNVKIWFYRLFPVTDLNFLLLANLQMLEISKQNAFIAGHYLTIISTMFGGEMRQASSFPKVRLKDQENRCFIVCVCPCVCECVSLFV